MENLAFIILPIALVFVAFRTKQDLAEYEIFKKLKSTKSRQAKYKKWALQSFSLFGIGSLISLALIGKLELITKPLVEFTNLLPKSTSTVSVSAGDSGGFIAGVLTSAIAAGLVVYIISKKGKSKKKDFVIGDIEAMLPKNGSERGWAAILALNAGFSEELFFRLLLPVLFFIVFGEPKLAIGLAVLTFGLVHWYQGRIGVIFTMVFGAIMSYVYLKTGSILVVMALHATVDLNSLVLQPMLRGLFRSRSV